MPAASARIGESASVIAEYREAMHSTTVERTPAPSGEPQGDLELRRNRLGTQEASIDSVRLSGADGLPVSEMASGRSLTVSLEVAGRPGPVSDPVVGVTVNRVSDGVVCYESTTEAAGVRLGTVDGPVTVELEFERLDLIPGDYVVDVGIYRSDWEYAYDYHWHAYPLRVVGPRHDKGVFRPPHRWNVVR